jgi:hypothetical protein
MTTMTTAAALRLPAATARGNRLLRLRGSAYTRTSRALPKLQSTDGDVAEVDGTPPPGCSRYSIEVRRPLGLVLEEDKSGSIYVAEIVGASQALLIILTTHKHRHRHRSHLNHVLREK